MPSIYETIDKFSGLITIKQAMSLDTESEVSDRSKTNSLEGKILSVDEILQLSNPNTDKNTPDAFTLNVLGTVYRIFNPTRIKTIKGETDRRYIVLGTEGSTIQLNLIGNSSDYIDSNYITRGDKVIIKNLLFNTYKNMLYSTKNTSIRKTETSDLPVLTLSEHMNTQKNIDITGKITEISVIRHLKQENKEITVSDFMIVNSASSIRVSAWGSSALMTERMSVNQYVRIEFCNVIERNGSLEIQANDISRILILNTKTGG